MMWRLSGAGAAGGVGVAVGVGVGDVLFKESRQAWGVRAGGPWETAFQVPH